MTDPVAIVSGAGRGICKEVALALANSGYVVAIVARSTDDLDTTLSDIVERGGTGLALPADVTDEATVATTVHIVQNELGPVDLLVNGAGRSAAVGPIWETTSADWWRDVEVNLRGPHLWNRAVLPSMIERRKGRIINIVSNASLNPHPYNSAYGASKAALAHYTGSIAGEIEPHGLSAFALSPGSVQTAMSRGVVESPAGKRWLGNLDASIGPRWTTPEHAVNAVLFLSSGDGDGLSGRFLHAVDDDIPALARRADEIKERDLHRLVLRRLDD
jgi:3-oxoacyl-[acyl-carrier protein] reductase